VGVGEKVKLDGSVSSDLRLDGLDDLLDARLLVDSHVDSLLGADHLKGYIPGLLRLPLVELFLDS